LAEKVRELQADPRIRKMVEDRVAEFKTINTLDTYRWYEELTYCLLTAFSSAAMGQKCVNALRRRNALLEGSMEEIRSCLIDTGHRFPNKRAEYIYNTQRLAPILKETIQSFNTSHEAREWLVKNIKGLGWKEASHYLRNVGYLDLAIIDRHIIDNLREHGIIELDPEKGFTKKRYLLVESILGIIAKEVNMVLGELDLYMWYRKTGQVLK